MRRTALLGFASLASAALGVSGCDFGTLDDLSQEEAVQGTDASGAQALGIWRAYEKGTDDDVKKAIANVDKVVEQAGSRPVQVKMLSLTGDDVKLVGIARDPAAAQGMLLISELDCSLDQVEKLVVAKNQTTIYPSLYDKYERTFTTSAPDFLSRAVPTVGWKTAYTATALSRTYEATLTGGARHVKGVNPLGGDVLLSRTVLDAPANFTKGDDAAFNQDYQIEIYYERSPKKVIHFYGLWREFRVGGLSSESDLYVNVVLGNLADFDIRTNTVCRTDNPKATFE